MKASRVVTVDEYLAEVLSEDSKRALIQLRKIILEQVPEAEETIAYGIPTYKFHGHLVSFAAFKNHCSFFPGHTVADFKKELAGFKILKGTVQFLPGERLPETVVRDILKIRVAENLAAAKVLLERNFAEKGESKW